MSNWGKFNGTENFTTIFITCESCIKTCMR